MIALSLQLICTWHEWTNMKNVTHLHNRRINNNLVVGVVMVHKGGFYEIWHWVSEEVRWNISYNQGPIHLFWVFPRHELGKKTIEPLSPEPAHPPDNLEDKLIWRLSLRIHSINLMGWSPYTHGPLMKCLEWLGSSNLAQDEQMACTPCHLISRQIFSLPPHWANRQLLRINAAERLMTRRHEQQELDEKYLVMAHKLNLEGYNSYLWAIYSSSSPPSLM
jgi:hypothetical protein